MRLSLLIFNLLRANSLSGQSALTFLTFPKSGKLVVHSYWKLFFPRMVLPLLLLALTVFHFKLCAQTRLIDSLVQQWPGMPADTNKVIIAYRLSGLFLNSDLEKSRAYGNEAILLADELDYKAGLIYANMNLGAYNWYKQEYQIASNHYHKVISIADQIGNKKAFVSGSNELGKMYVLLGKYEEAFKHFDIAKKLVIETNDKERLNRINQSLIFAYGMQAGNYHAQGNYTETLKCDLLKLKIAEEMNDQGNMADSYNNIGELYLTQRNYELALENFLAALTLYEESKNKQGIPICNTNLGLTYHLLGKKDKALPYMLAALKGYQDSGDKQGISNNHVNLGGLYIDSNEFNKAISHFEEALRLSREIGDSGTVSGCYFRLGQINTKIGNYQMALDFFERAIDISKSLRMLEVLSNSYLAWSQLDSLSGNQHLALVHYKQYVAYRDSLNDEAQNQMMTEMTVKFETEKKDREILRLENEKEINALTLQVKNESLARMQFQQDKLNVLNLFQMERIDLLDKEKQLQQLELEKNQCNIVAQQAETQKQEDQLLLLDQQGKIKDLELARKAQIQYYMLAGFLLSALLGIYMYSNYRTQQKLKLQILRNKIANDLHDDVGSTLSSISIFSEMAQQQSKETIPLLNTIHESSRKMLDAMADIVWTINPENDQFERIIMRMQNFAYDLLGAKGIDFQFTADEETAQVRLPMEVRKNFYLIFKEATNNLVKYAEASRAQYSITNERNIITMLIRDNGKGFNPDATVLGNGLKSMRKRAEEMGGTLIFDSRPGEGTSVMLKIAV